MDAVSCPDPISILNRPQGVPTRKDYSVPDAKSKIRICQKLSLRFTVEIEQEEDGRWIAEVLELPGALAYGHTIEEAKARVQALALRLVADRLDHGETGPELLSISFAAA